MKIKSRKVRSKQRLDMYLHKHLKMKRKMVLSKLFRGHKNRVSLLLQYCFITVSLLSYYLFITFSLLTVPVEVEIDYNPQRWSFKNNNNFENSHKYLSKSNKVNKHFTFLNETKLTNINQKEKNLIFWQLICNKCNVFIFKQT